MAWINNIIFAIEKADLYSSAYSTINSIANWIAIAFGLFHGLKLKRVGLLPVAVTVAVDRMLLGYLATAILFVENGFSPPSVNNGVVAFPYIPLLGFLVSKIVRRSYREIWDVMMVTPLVMFAGARIACTVVGCCRGYPCSWGVYNLKVDDYLFPIQLLECLVAVLILIFVIWREKRNNFVPDGRNVPIILISYGITRFFLEFLHDNEKIIFGCASTSFHCLIMIAVGIITLRIIQNSEKKALS